MNKLLEIYRHLIDARDDMIAYTRMKEKLEGYPMYANRASITTYDNIIHYLESEIIVAPQHTKDELIFTVEQIDRVQYIMTKIEQYWPLSTVKSLEKAKDIVKEKLNESINQSWFRCRLVNME